MGWLTPGAPGLTGGLYSLLTPRQNIQDAKTLKVIIAYSKYLFRPENRYRGLLARDGKFFAPGEARP
jgi:hypothetical protein